MKVYKFGGTSVGTPDRMKHVAELVTADKEKKIIVGAWLRHSVQRGYDRFVMSLESCLVP